MKTALISTLLVLSTSLLGQHIPAQFADSKFERLSENLVVFTENSDEMYSKICGFEVVELKRFKKHNLIAETRIIDGVKVITVIDTKTGGNPYVFKYSHYVGEKKKGA